MSGHHLIVAAVALPLLGAVGAFIVGGRAARHLAVGVTVLNVGTALVLATSVARQGLWTYDVGGWGAPLGIGLAVDGLGALMLLLTAAIGLAIVAFAGPYLAQDGGSDASEGSLFWPLWCAILTGLNALFISADVFNMYVCLEVLGLSAIALVALAGTPASLSAALRYLFLALFGSLAYLLGVGFLYAACGNLEVSALAALLQPGLPVYAALGLMVVGLLLKAALFPLHFWLPPAHANAPAPVSALLSGLVVTAAFYLMARLWFQVFGPVVPAAAAHGIGALACGAILWGGAQAFIQERLKLLVAYSTVSQLGYMFLVFPLSVPGGLAAEYAWQGGVYAALAHGCAKAAAFLAAGALMHQLGHDRIRDLRGAGWRMPVLVAAFGLAGVSLMGLPPSGGFVAKWMLLKAALLGGQWWYAATILAGGLLAFAYVFRVLERAMTAPAASDPPVATPWGLAVPAMALSLVAIALGVASAWPLALLGPLLPGGGP